MEVRITCFTKNIMTMIGYISYIIYDFLIVDFRFYFIQMIYYLILGHYFIIVLIEEYRWLIKIALLSLSIL